jgi:hypothetical protein
MRTQKPQKYAETAEEDKAKGFGRFPAAID